MRVVVHPGTMEIGGSQLNAVELAARVRDLGHDVLVFAPDGALGPVAEGLGLEHVRSRTEGRPSWRDVRSLHSLVRRRDVDLVHAYEWAPAANAAAVAALVPRLATVTTVLSMSVPAEVPRYGDLVVGTEALRAQQAALRPRVHLMEPPIDTRRSSPREPRAARARLGLDAGATIVSVVCRLSDDLGKLAGVLAAVRVVGRLARTDRVQLLVAGDGPGLGRVRAEGAAVDAAAGRSVVVCTGGLLDPSDAYAAADVVLGMGSSALKGMAFGKPLVVQGEEGYWRLLDAGSAPEFLARGFHGHGGAGEADLEAILRALDDTATRGLLGAFGRDLVCRRFSLDAAADRLVDLYDDALRRPRRERRAVAEAVHVGRELGKAAVADWVRRHLGGGLRSTRRRARGQGTGTSPSPGPSGLALSVTEGGR